MRGGWYELSTSIHLFTAWGAVHSVFYNSQLHNVLYFWLKYNVSEMVLKNGSIDKITVQFKELAI